MSAGNEIRAAFVKLAAIRDEPTSAARFSTVDESADQWFARAEIKLAIFHRTIDGQLAILRDAVDRFDWACGDRHGLLGSADALALARAINGADPAVTL